MSSPNPPLPPTGDVAGTFHKIVLTGGPCGGKSTVQLMLSDVFQNMGYRVYRVTETATVLLNGGVIFSQLNAVQSKQFQLNLLKVMLALETTYFDLASEDAKNGHKAIVICDRGCMDPSAYMNREDWLAILKEASLSENALRDSRYDCVIHLVTAANGAEAFFGSENNPIRSEGLTFARQLDDAVAKAWLGHPYFDIIDNSTPFLEKQNRVVEAVLKRLGLNDTRHGKNIVKKKFLLKDFEFGEFSTTSEVLDPTFPVDYRDFIVQHDYLLPSSTESSEDRQTRLRKREFGGAVLYSLTHRKPVVDGQIVEVRRVLTSQQFEVFFDKRDPKHASIQKKRRCFVYEHQSFQLDYFVGPVSAQGLVLLEAYVNSETEQVHIPPFLKVEKEVTGDPKYSMFTLSQID